MIGVLSWNIQAGRGVDGRVDLARIARVVRDMGAPPVVCLQEVARHFPGADGSGQDQPAVLADHLPGYRPVFAAALELGHGDAPHRQFGNLVLTRLPVVQVLRHLLPARPDSGDRYTPRVALEVVLEAPAGPLRVMTTHLEFHAHAHRAVQVERLRQVHAEAAAHDRAGVAAGADSALYGPRHRPAEGVLCGDLNFPPADPLYERLQAPFADGAPRLVDAWPQVHGSTAHAPTAGVADRAQWPQGPHCRDFFFVTKGLLPRVVGLEVNSETDASDHQPLLLRLA